MYEFQFNVSCFGKHLFRTDWYNFDDAQRIEAHLRQAFSCGDYAITIHRRDKTFVALTTLDCVEALQSSRW